MKRQTERSNGKTRHTGKSVITFRLPLSWSECHFRLQSYLIPRYRLTRVLTRLHCTHHNTRMRFDYRLQL